MYQSNLSSYYLGGAFTAGLQELALYPNNWSVTQTHSGYWLHPMGFDAARKGGYINILLSRYKIKSYVYEADLIAWTNGVNHLQTTQPWIWGTFLEKIDPSYQQACIVPNVGGDRIALNLQDTLERYQTIQNKMLMKGYPNTFLFYSPPSPASIKYQDILLNGRIDNLPYIEYLVMYANLSGIALDYPASLYLANSANKAKDLAKQAWNVCQKHNISLLWVFNGGDSHTKQAVNAIYKDGIFPNSFAIDNFASVDNSGVPETNQESMSGQIYQLIINDNKSNDAISFRLIIINIFNLYIIALMFTLGYFVYNNMR